MAIIPPLRRPNVPEQPGRARDRLRHGCRSLMTCWNSYAASAMWATQDVAQPAYHTKVFRHPLYPRLDMTSTSFAVPSAPGTRVVVCPPDNEATWAAMRRLLADPVEHRFPCWPGHQARARELVTN